MNFKDRTVVVTGGTRGIGAGITKAFLNAGAQVVSLYANNDDAARKFYESINSDMLSVKKVDVSSVESVEAFFREFDERFQKIDVLVNNAGVRKDSIAGMLSEENWDSVLDINLKGSFLMTKNAITRMSLERYGRIINLSSPSGRLGFAGQANYSASKAGLMGMTRSICKEVAKRKITINCVSPGFIDTELLTDLDDSLVKEYKKLVPANRFGTVEEVAEAVLFLASEKAAYINGSCLEVSGGL